MAMAVENWDNDADFEGDFHAYAANSVGTAPTNISSRMSVHSESLAGDDDWNVVLRPNDEQSTTQAIQSVQQAGIPIPIDVPASALLGGTIKRLGKKNSQAKVGGDDWDNDLEMPDTGALTLKPHTHEEAAEIMDDFDDLEGSLGIRFAGTTRDQRNRSSSASAMSPSMGSATNESEEDELRGLELPEGPMDFDAILLKKRRAGDAELSDLSQASPAVEQQATMNNHKKSKLSADDNDDFFDDFDLNGGDVFDSRKRNINKNLKLKGPKPPGSTARPATTLNFHDKPTDKPTHMRSQLPRPVSGAKQTSRLEPVFETGATQLPRERRQAASTTAQLLRNKRSMPVLSSRQQAAATGRPHPTFLPTSTATQHTQSSAAAQRAVPYHLRRDSDPNNRRGAASPPPRPSSRLSNAYLPDTPSRPPRRRPDVAPAALAREAAAKRTVTKPTRRRNFGDGTELENFDDLPTSTQKESKYMKQPTARGPPKLGLRQTQSRSDMRETNKRNFAVPERMMTPAPRTPASPTKGFYDAPSQTPSYLRDTAASRIARESRLNNNPRPRSEGPLMPLSTNWKAQVAARSPQGSPSASRKTGKRSTPTLIKNLGANIPKTEKGMVYNPQTMRWEGNENTLSHFEMPLETPTPTSSKPYPGLMDRRALISSSPPPRPALIAPALGAASHGVQVNSGMVFDPRQMKWLKLKEGREVSGQLSPSIADGEEDVFAGIDDLPDERSPPPPALSISGPIGLASPMSIPAAGVDVHEEFDLGPAFINRQCEEEVVWRKRCQAWFPAQASRAGGKASEPQPRADDGAWRWAIRDIVPQGEPATTMG